ncbi:MAG: hypothetical protein H0X66_08540 [Verrucomicrobia bacterium]|nr:hypothetical protein [Verrucomicrobiota bacterium]
MEQPPPLPGRSSPPPLPKNSGTRALIIVLSILVGGIVLVGVLAAIFIPNIVREVSKPKVVVSSDEQFSLTVPRLWTELKELHQEGELRYGNKYAETYVIVLTDAKEDLDEDLTLESHSDLTREGIVSSLAKASVSKPTRLTINGDDAIQYEISGSADNINIVYFHTTVEDEDHFHQILTWTLKSRFSKNKDEMRKVVSSFKANAPKKQAEN